MNLLKRNFRIFKAARACLGADDAVVGADVDAGPVGGEALGVGVEGAAPCLERDVGDRKSTRLNSSHITRSRMPSSA